jgi:hypothetical protein
VFTGSKKTGYKTIQYLKHPDYEPPPCGSFYQTDALELQKDQDFLDALIAAPAWRNHEELNHFRQP